MSVIDKKSCNTPVDVADAAEPKSNCTDVVWSAPATAVAPPARALAANAGKQPLSFAIKGKLVAVAP